MTRLVDLSMPVHRDMITFPQIPPPTLLMYESWTISSSRAIMWERIAML